MYLSISPLPFSQRRHHSEPVLGSPRGAVRTFTARWREAESDPLQGAWGDAFEPATSANLFPYSSYDFRCPTGGVIRTS